MVYVSQIISLEEITWPKYNSSTGALLRFSFSEGEDQAP